jgi:hypothetical protein
VQKTARENVETVSAKGLDLNKIEISRINNLLLGHKQILALRIYPMRNISVRNNPARNNPETT